MQHSTSNSPLPWRKEDAIVRRRSAAQRKLTKRGGIRRSRPQIKSDNHQEQTNIPEKKSKSVVEAAKQLCGKLRGEQGHRRLVANTTDQQTREQINSALLLIRMDDFDLSQRQRFNLSVPPGVPLPQQPDSMLANNVEKIIMNDNNRLLKNKTEISGRQQKWEVLYPYTLEDPRQVAALKEKRTSDKETEKMASKGRVDSSSLNDDDSVAFPSTKIFIDPNASIDALKTVSRDVDLPAPFYLEIGRRYARAGQEAQALHYLDLVITEERPVYECELRKEEQEQQEAEQERNGTKRDEATRNVKGSHCKTANYEKPLDELLAEKAIGIREKIKKGVNVVQRDRSWLDRYRQYQVADASERVRRKRMAHHLCFEVLIKHAYDANSDEEAIQFHKARDHICMWLATFQDNGATCHVAPTSNKRKKKKAILKPGFGKLALSIKSNPLGKPLGSIERQQKREQHIQQHIISVKSKIEPKIDQTEIHVIPNSHTILEALTELHHTFTSLRDIQGPLRVHSPGDVASNKTIGPMGDLHIAVLERLCAKMLGLADVHDLLLARKVAPELHGLNHLSSFWGNSHVCQDTISLATPPALTALIVKSQIKEYTASDLFLSLGEMYSLRKEYTKAESLLSLYARCSLNPGFACQVDIHSSRLSNFKKYKIPTTSCTAIPSLTPVVKLSDRINNMAAVASTSLVVDAEHNESIRMSSFGDPIKTSGVGSSISAHKWQGAIETWRVAPNANEYVPVETPIRLGAKLLMATAGSKQAKDLSDRLTWWTASPELILPSDQTYIGANGVRLKHTQQLTNAICNHATHNDTLKYAVRKSVEWNIGTERPHIHCANLPVLKEPASLLLAARQAEQRGMIEAALESQQGETILTLRENEAKITWQKAHVGLSGCVEEPPGKLDPYTQIKADKTMLRVKAEMEQDAISINGHSLVTSVKAEKNKNRFKNAWTLAPMLSDAIVLPEARSTQDVHGTDVVVGLAKPIRGI